MSQHEERPAVVVSQVKHNRGSLRLPAILKKVRFTKKKLVMLWLALILVAAVGIAMYVVLHKRPAAAPKLTKEQKAEDSVKELYEESLKDTTVIATVKSFKNDVLTLQENDSKEIKLKLTDETIYGTGKDGLDGTKTDLNSSEGRSIVVTYDNTKNIVLNISFNEELES